MDDWFQHFQNICSNFYFIFPQGTEIYDAKRGSFVDLSILDVLQIFGRAGRPQFDKTGLGIIIMSHYKFGHFLSLLTDQFPIDSNFINYLADNLNAEVIVVCPTPPPPSFWLWHRLRQSFCQTNTFSKTVFKCFVKCVYMKGKAYFLVYFWCFCQCILMWLEYYKIFFLV